MLSALDDTSMLQHLNRGHRARNEHRAASPTINVNVLKHCGAFREASPEIAAQLSGASRLPPPPAPCPGGIFAAIASRDRHRRPAGHSRALEQQAGSITGAAAQLETNSAPRRPPMIECLRTGWGNNAAKLRLVFKRVVTAHLFAITEETLGLIAKAEALCAAICYYCYY